jgi:hypothetical protein
MPARVRQSHGRRIWEKLLDTSGLNLTGPPTFSGNEGAVICPQSAHEFFEVGKNFKQQYKNKDDSDVNP